jgi:hypothetical protein
MEKLVFPAADDDRGCGRRIASDGYRVHVVSDPGRVHDVLNDVSHCTVAATIVLFLERPRLGADLPPIAVSEKL